MEALRREWQGHQNVHALAGSGKPGGNLARSRQRQPNLKGNVAREYSNEHMRLSGRERVEQHRSGRADKLQDTCRERLEAIVLVQRLPHAWTRQVDGDFLEHLPLGEHNDAVAEEYRFANIVSDEE